MKTINEFIFKKNMLEFYKKCINVFTIYNIIKRK